MPPYAHNPMPRGLSPLSSVSSQLETVVIASIRTVDIASVSTEEEDEEDNDDAVSVHSSTSSYIDVEDFTTTSGSVAPTEVEADDFDFVDEEVEDDLTEDEL